MGKAPLVIGGTFSENSLLGTNYVVSLDTYDQYFQQQLDAFVMVKLEPGADATAVTASVVAATTEFGNVEVQDQTAFRDQQAGFIDQLLGLISALLFFAILIALFGIVNTLGLSIFERTRELGLLRAVGMSRKQIKRMIRWESVIISIIGALLGVVIGVFFGFALQQALASEGVTELVIPVGSLARLRDPRRAGRCAGRHLARAPRGQAGRAGVHLVRVGRRPADIMARMPHVKLVEGSDTDLPEGEPIGSVLPPDAIAARVDGELRDLSFVPTSDATVEAVRGVGRRRSPCAAALDRPRDGAGRVRPAPRGEVRDRPGDRGRLLLRHRASRAALVRRPPRDRGPDARARGGRRAVHPRGGRSRGRARAVRRPAVQGRDHPGPGRRRGGGRGRRRRRRHALPQRRLGRPVSRPARAVHRDDWARSA